MNYGYHEFVPLTINEILLRVSQEEIFSIVYQPVLNEFILSPLREDDSNPKCYFEWYNDKLYFIDFAYSTRPLDCFGFIGEYYGLSHYKVLSLVNEHFELGLGYSLNSPKPVRIKHNNQVVTEKNTTIFFNPRPYINEDGKFWSRFKITKQQLVSDHVYAVRWYKIQSSKTDKIIRPFFPTYAIYEFKPRIKLYAPQSKKLKWITNCNANDIGNINNIDVYGLHLLITKSYKDCRVIRNIGKKNVIWFQNEGMIPDSKYITMLGKRFRNISVLFDNDESGKKALIKVVNTLNLHFPGKFDGYTLTDYNDPAEMVEHAGDKPLIQFFKHNHLLL